MKIKYNRENDASHIKRLATSKEAPVNSDSDKSVSLTRKN